ncbi:MAG: hypothetical protein ACF8MF_08655 [Phycisphaerales bacterium JB052]
MKSRDIATLVLFSVFSSISVAQMVYTIPPDKFPSQQDFDNNHAAVVNIDMLNQLSDSFLDIDLNDATINVLGSFFPPDRSTYRSGVFVVNGRLGAEPGDTEFVDTQIRLQSGMMDRDTVLRGTSSMKITGGTFLEDFSAYDASRLEVYSGTFYPDQGAYFAGESVFEIFGGTVSSLYILFGQDQARCIVRGGSIRQMSWIDGFDLVQIFGGVWDEIYLGKEICIDSAVLEIEGSCFAVEGVRIESVVGEPIEFSGSQLLQAVSVVLPNQTPFRTLVMNQSGTVIFIPTGKPCVSDFDCSASLDFFDISIFVDKFVEQDQIADLDGDGDFDFFDISIFVNGFAQGCS